MCPVILLSLIFSLLLLLLEITAAINVTFSPFVLPKIREDAEFPVNFYVNNDKYNTEPDEELYKVVSKDPDIASVTNYTYFDSNSKNGSFVIRGNFIGKTSIQIEKHVNGTLKEKSNPLKVTIVRRDRLITSIFTASVAILVSLTYVNMGCALDFAVVKSVLRKPVAPGIGFLSQYLVLPLVACGLARLVFDDLVLQFGLFTFGCSPGGGASNMWTVLLNGNLNLSLTMTFISNLAALGMMPLWLFTLGHTMFSEITTKVPVQHILTYLFSMLVSLAIGLCFQKWLPRVAKFCRRILAPVSVFMIIFIIIFGSYANFYMFKLFTWKIIVASGATVWLGFIFGTIISKAFDLSLPDIITVAIETGVQNTGVAIVLLKLSLGEPEYDFAAVVPVAASVMTPFPLLIAYAVLKVRNQYFPIQESRLYVMDDEEEKKPLPTLDSSSSIVSSKVL